MIYFKKPEKFDPQFSAVSCYLLNSGKILLLKRQPHKPQGKKWGPPAGKVEKGESIHAAVIREVFEETGITITPPSLSEHVTLYVMQEKYHFIWHMFLAHTNIIEVVIRHEEHSDFMWIEPRKALGLDLAEDEKTCMQHMF
jgi:8-oxo-dGTP diphosphatase